MTLISVLEMELNTEGPNVFEVVLSENTPGIGKAGERVTISLGNADEALGAGTPAAMIAKTVLPLKPATYSMSGTLQMDAEDSKALQKALNALPRAPCTPILSVQSITEDTVCACGHEKWRHHVWIKGPDENCQADGCYCKEFRL